MACKFGVDTVETVRGMGRGRVSIVGAKNRYDIVGNDIGFATSTKVVKKEEKKKRKGKKEKGRRRRRPGRSKRISLSLLFQRRQAS